MKSLAFSVVLGLAVLTTATAFAGGRCGGYGGGYGGGYRGGYGGGYGGWCGPGWGGGWGPAYGVNVIVPAPVVYRTVYVAQPAPAYVNYRQPTVARAQVRLARLGYYPGPIDGDFGPMTNQAIRTYQRDYGLPVTGRLDRNTVVSLGV